MGTNFGRRRDAGPRAPSRADPGSEGLWPAGRPGQRRGGGRSGDLRGEEALSPRRAASDSPAMPHNSIRSGRGGLCQETAAGSGPGGAVGTAGQALSKCGQRAEARPGPR
ncbi:hypothetical protein J1605_005642 [Eschrichtius robustus]|uniref:Uncharacterized protein n=1 Tax=Eschrichtius robustus TaxID=9764 RepID=A0AB34HBH0_ESCRO|nr:hypothetical protein J1605_005642 [Eschrichtius robustus]